MNKRTFASSALASALAFAAGHAAAATVPTASAASEKEKCYGIAKVGENDCATDVHSCAGQTKSDNNATDWKYVAKGTCAKMGGTLSVAKK